MLFRRYCLYFTTDFYWISLIFAGKQSLIYMSKRLLITCLISMLASLSFAQKAPVTDSCQDPYLHSEMVEQNSSFLQQGFSVNLFKVVHFPKNTYVPVRIHMEQGQMYQINFVANRFFQTVTITLMGKEKMQIFQEKFKGKTSQQHWFSKSVVAPYTGDYWAIMSQKAKGRDMVCGGLSVLEAGGSQ